MAQPIRVLWLLADGSEADVESLMEVAGRTRGLPAWMSVVLAEAMLQVAAAPATMLHQWLERPHQMAPDVEQAVRDVATPKGGSSFAELVWVRVRTEVEAWAASFAADTVGRSEAENLRQGRMLAQARWESYVRNAREQGRKRVRPARDDGLEEARRMERHGRGSHAAKVEAVRASTGVIARAAVASSVDPVRQAGKVSELHRERKAAVPSRAGPSTAAVASAGVSVYRAKGLSAARPRARSIAPAGVMGGAAAAASVVAESGWRWRRAFCAVLTPPRYKGMAVRSAHGENFGVSPASYCPACSVRRKGGLCAVCRSSESCEVCLRRDGCKACSRWDEAGVAAWQDERRRLGGRLHAGWGWELALARGTGTTDGEALSLTQSAFRPACVRPRCGGAGGLSDAGPLLLQCEACGDTWQSSWWAGQLRAAAGRRALGPPSVAHAATQARLAVTVGEDDEEASGDCDSEVDAAIALMAGVGTWRCECTATALLLCVHCGEPVCGVVGCKAHGRTSCSMQVEEFLREVVSAQLEAARDITGCVVALAGVWTTTAVGTRVQGKELRLPFPSLGIWARGEGMAFSWREGMLHDDGEAAHRHEETEGQRNPAVRRQAGFGWLADVLAEGAFAIDHETIKRRMRERQIQDGQWVSAAEQAGLRATCVRHDMPLHTMLAGHAHAMFVAQRGPPLHDAYISTEERARIDEIPRLVLLRGVLTPLQVQEAAGLGGHGAVWRAVPRRVLELLPDWRRKLGRKGACLTVSSLGTGVVDGATDGVCAAMSGICQVRVVCAAEVSAERQAGWKVLYDGVESHHYGEHVSVRPGACVADARSPAATQDAPYTEWLSISLECPPMSPATRLSAEARGRAVFHLCCDLWSCLYLRMAGRPLERLPVVVEVEMVEAQLWQLEGVAGLQWNGVLLAVPYVWLGQSICPFATLRRPVRRGRVIDVGIRRDVAEAAVRAVGGGAEAWHRWVDRGAPEEVSRGW